VNPRYRIRFILVYVSFLAAFGAVLFRLLWVQVWNHDFYAALALQQQRERDDLPAARGVIYDRELNPLAMSRPLYNVYCLPRLVKDARAAARMMAPVLGAPEKDLEARCRARADSVWLGRDVPAATAAKVIALGLEGVFATPCERRLYPEGPLACHLLGYVGARDGSKAGLERTLNVYLEGLPGISDGGADAAGRALPDLNNNFVAPMHGLGCVLTINKWCQYVAERELAAACREANAAGGAVVVMRPRTGEILAMASYPGYDPNVYGEFAPETWRNNAVGSAIEPGSIIKPFVVAAALEEKVAGPADSFDCSQPMMFGKYKVADVKPVAKPLSLEEVLTHSSNVGVIQIGQRLGGRRYYEYLTRFGFGERTGIALPAENPGILRAREFGRPLGCAYACFGQGFSATPLQLTLAGCALANGGVLMEPMILSALVDQNGKTVRRFQPKAIRRALSAETSARVLAMMEKVVTDGGGKLAQVPGYRVAGKTGTSEVAVAGGGGYLGGAYNASFLGIAPADDPKVVVFITIHKPQGKHFGGDVAAPVYARIARDILPALRVPPEGTGHIMAAGPPPLRNERVALGGVSAAAAIKSLSGLGLKTRLGGRGADVIWSSADGGPLPEPGGVVLLEVGGPAAMPDVEGLSVREALRLLGPLGVRVSLDGAGGWVHGQTPKAGGPIGAACRLRTTSSPPRPVPVAAPSPAAKTLAEAAG